jgi:hypothetical protein
MIVMKIKKNEFLSGQFIFQPIFTLKTLLKHPKSFPTLFNNLKTTLIKNQTKKKSLN